jgi:hypothetical protein
MNRFSALLPGPVLETKCDVGQTILNPLKPTNYYQALYCDYVEKYYTFEFFANLIRPGFVPETRRTMDGRTQYTIPALNDLPKEDQIQDQDVCTWIQEQAHNQWQELVQRMDELCNHEFVHLSSPHTKFEPVGGFQVDMNKDVSDKITLDVEIIKNELATDMWYRPSLMRVVMQP